VPAAWAAEQDEQERVASEFIKAFFRSDIDRVETCIPDKVTELFGPYPFTGEIKLGQPKCDGFQALLEFTAPVGDAKFPAKGGILFRRKDTTWYVRQVLFYDKVPKLFNLPTKSVNEADKNYESVVKALGITFLEAWQNGNAGKMGQIWYNWANITKEPIKGLSVSNIAFTPGTTAWRDPYLQYTAKVTYRWGLLSYSMRVKGGLMLMRNGDGWKVRANTLVFDF